MIERLSDEAEALFLAAQVVARRRGHAMVAAGHVLLGALEPVGDELGAALSAARVAAEDPRGVLEGSVATAPAGEGGETLALDQALPPLLQAAGRAAAGRGDD